MQTLLLHAFFVSLACVCIHTITQEHKLLFPVRQLIDRLTANKFLAWIRKPIYDCLPCMASVYGIGWSLWMELGVSPMVIIILLTCGINAIFDALIYGMRALIEISNAVESMKNGTDFPE